MNDHKVPEKVSEFKKDEKMFVIESPDQ